MPTLLLPLASITDPPAEPATRAVGLAVRHRRERRGPGEAAPDARAA